MFKQIKRVVVMWSVVALSFATATARDIHVATNGSDASDGTEAAPLETIEKAMEEVRPGDRILVHEGTYYPTKRIKVPALNTTPELRCELRAWPDEAVGKVIIDGSRMNPQSENEFKQSRCIYVNHLVNYWTFYGLVLQNAKDNGMKLEGSYNIVERCTFCGNNDTGLQIGMYKSFSIEETQQDDLPEGLPEFNPDFRYCRYNKIINCDSHDNADIWVYNNSTGRIEAKEEKKRGGDADGFACKLFPGPGNEFHGCRAWTNSDDNWDLYMVYHPVVIDHCWAYNAGYYKDELIGNGNGFKLGGGGTSGGIDFDKSVGAHVVTNCVAFRNPIKGFDQNNANEGIYIINCVAWENGTAAGLEREKTTGSLGNYKFSQSFAYGDMFVRNSIGWGGIGKTAFNSNADMKNNLLYDGGTDYSAEFLSLSPEDFMQKREADGSLPNNNFARLVKNSTMKDKGTPIVDFEPKRWMTKEQATKFGLYGVNLELTQASNITIPYNDAAPDLGAFELDATYQTVDIDKDEGLSTYCPKYGVDFTEETEIAAYKATVNDNMVALTRVSTVAAGEGVLIRSLNGGKITKKVPVDTNITANEENAFVGTLQEITLQTKSEDGLMTNYVLAKMNDNIGFYKANNTKVTAGKAYLPIATGSNAAALNIMFNDDLSAGIIIPTNGLATDETTIYNLNGQRMSRPTAKGVYIVNGQKFVIK